MFVILIGTSIVIAAPLIMRVNYHEVLVVQDVHIIASTDARVIDVTQLVLAQIMKVAEVAAIRDIVPALPEVLARQS